MTSAYPRSGAITKSRQIVGPVHQPTGLDHRECGRARLWHLALQESHREASQPAQIVAQGAFSAAAVILAEVPAQHPVHRLDAPMAANGLAETFAAEVTAE